MQKSKLVFACTQRNLESAQCTLSFVSWIQLDGSHVSQASRTVVLWIVANAGKTDVSTESSLLKGSWNHLLLNVIEHSQDKPRTQSAHVT